MRLTDLVGRFKFYHMKQLKLLIVLSGFLSLTVSSFAQGAIDFRSLGSGGGSTTVNAPITNWNGILASGSGFFAQLYAGANTNSLSPVGAPVAFSGVALGYFFGPILQISGFNIGTTPTLVVRAWENNGGAVTNFFDAIAATLPYGQSVAIVSPALGDPLNALTIPVLNGLQGFALVPEPSVTVLAALGALGVFLRARRKA